MYREHGWLPKWELYGRETLTMEGDPSIPVVVDTWLKGLRDFDIDLAYEAMYKSATLPGAENLLRPDNDDYMSLGYVPLREQYDNSVSHALEYYIADYSLSLLADALGKRAAEQGKKAEARKYQADARLFYNRSLGYKHYYSKEFGTFRPILPDGQFYSPFNPRQGENFEPNSGFHEGCAWNYSFYVPHDVKGLARLMGGQKPFIENFSVSLTMVSMILPMNPTLLMLISFLISRAKNGVRKKRLEGFCRSILKMLPMVFPVMMIPVPCLPGPSLT